MRKRFLVTAENYFTAPSRPQLRAGRRRRFLHRSPAGASGSAARRRLLHRSPPSQRRSEMVSLTERFIAIEERRADAELIVARSHELYAQSQQAMVGAVVQLAQAFNALAENFVRANNNN